MNCLNSPAKNIAQIIPFLKSTRGVTLRLIAGVGINIAGALVLVNETQRLVGLSL